MAVVGEERLVASNRKAFHDYFIEDRYEAGIALTGTEIQSVRRGRVNLRDSFARIEGGEAILYDMHISPWEYAHYGNHDPKRPRKLLLHKSEIRKLEAKATIRGYSLIPLRLYFKGPWLKVELAVAKGKKAFDKREAIAERERRVETQRRLKERQHS
ncbi:MAG TPA: SsrA-binding protein SmpB [Bacillota bacterium]|nr:SsrA-binding protein SmpB [Bacillota bacterium]HPZ53457.1 SsrA-binding protein SmpB [Bacillota bacterium]HQD18736.1 SsrA-binding protein SmpB [Bacillota bacterium]